MGLICQRNTDGGNCEKCFPLINNRIRRALSTGGNHLRQLKDAIVSGAKKKMSPAYSRQYEKPIVQHVQLFFADFVLHLLCP